MVVDVAPAPEKASEALTDDALAAWLNDALAAGISPPTIAAEMGMSDSQVSHMKAGRRYTPNSRVALAAALAKLSPR